MKIFFNDKVVILSPEDFKDRNEDESIKIKDVKQIGDFIRLFHSDESDRTIQLYGYKYDKLVYEFKKNYKYIEAAGGIVVNSNDDFLIIKRWELWDLPKGKIEKGESPNHAAIREVCEETGLTSVQICDELPYTFHIYQRKEKWYLKKTYWYSMKTEDQNVLVPQTDEDITEAVWMCKSDAKKAIAKSYRSITEILGFIFD